MFGENKRNQILKGFTNLEKAEEGEGKKSFPGTKAKDVEGTGQKWITVNGRHILLGGDGDVVAGGKGMGGEGKDFEGGRKTKAGVTHDGSKEEAPKEERFSTETKNDRKESSRPHPNAARADAKHKAAGTIPPNQGAGIPGEKIKIGTEVTYTDRKGNESKGSVHGYHDDRYLVQDNETYSLKKVPHERVSGGKGGDKSAPKGQNPFDKSGESEEDQSHSFSNENTYPIGRLEEMVDEQTNPHLSADTKARAQEELDKRYAEKGEDEKAEQNYDPSALETRQFSEALGMKEGEISDFLETNKTSVEEMRGMIEDMGPDRTKENFEDEIASYYGGGKKDKGGEVMSSDEMVDFLDEQGGGIIDYLKEKGHDEEEIEAFINEYEGHEDAIISGGRGNEAKTKEELLSNIDSAMGAF